MGLYSSDSRLTLKLLIMLIWNDAEIIVILRSNAPVVLQKILRELNNRTFEELSNTTGIGKNKATTLMQYRENFGSMKLVDELFQVKGFGSAFLKKLEEMGELPPVKKKTPKGLETIWELLKHNDKEVGVFSHYLKVYIKLSM